MSRPNETRFEKLSPPFFDAVPFCGADGPAGDAVLEVSGDGFSERLEKALGGADDGFAG